MPVPQGWEEYKSSNQRQEWVKKFPDGYVTVVGIEESSKFGEGYTVYAEGYPNGIGHGSKSYDIIDSGLSRSGAKRTAWEWMRASNPGDERYMHPKEYFDL